MNTPLVKEYTVDVEVRDKSSGTVDRRSHTQYAYNPVEAVQQAIFFICGTEDTDKVQVTVLRVMPPQSLIASFVESVVKSLQEQRGSK